MSDFGNLKRYTSANLKLKNLAPVPNCIVFFGDSITEFWSNKNGLIARNPNYVNRGISSQVTSQMVLRFQQDVVDLNPETVVILAGINDIAENNGPISLKEIFENIVAMIEKARQNKIKTIICSVLPANRFSWRKDIAPADSIVKLNEMLCAYAQENSIPFVDYYSQMVDSEKGLQANYTEDGVHPNSEGYKKMEAILVPFLR